MVRPLDLPPPPRGLKGRAIELDTLSRTIEQTAPARLALVGSGGSGKSMLASALAHRLANFFERRVSWFRVGAWDYYTLTEMLALRFGVPGGDERVERLNAFFEREGSRLIVLDNHEDDRAMSRLLDAFADAPVTFVITARRCLLAGVLIYPVVAPLVTAGQSAFPRVSKLTRRLRWNPLALDIADGIVASHAASVAELADFLEQRGVGRVRAIAHEDDLPEIAFLVEWAWQRLGTSSRRILGVLAHIEGDHVDRASLGKLAGIRGKLEPALEPLLAWRLVQEPVKDRFTLHAVVRYALTPRTELSPEVVFEHYMSLLENSPERLELEQTHLFAAMDYAHRTSNFNAILRVEALARRLAGFD
ncbi:MAG TPA: hypothetical protein VHV51_16015 [Polyangiaceae bacterium]|jgi:hypothetical protein|nr:hypothetical protein [Polyangiaceae bacterium]